MKTEIIGVQGQRSQKDLAPKDQEAGGRSSADLAHLYSKIVEHYAMCFDRPEDRLRFLNNTVIRQKKRQEHLRNSLRYLGPLKRTRFYDWILEGRLYGAILEEMTTLARQLPANRQPLLLKVEVPLSARLLFFFREARHAIYATSLIMFGVLLIGLYSAVKLSAGKVNNYLEVKYRKTREIIVEKGRDLEKAAPSMTPKFLPTYKPDKIWLVGGTKAEGYEKYSNGCRIRTEYETDNYPRGYYTIPRGSDTNGDQIQHAIVGIVYHTSESHILPFTPTNNDEIQQLSQGLLGYVRRIKAYNYVIDRYGEIYRVVRDDQAADHAGWSIWADDKNIYVALNNSFLGICFESTVQAETLEETLTDAQITSGIALTNLLRWKYNIADANCTTHGLVSIKPDKMLIAFHHDWVRNFPFELMGLSNKYKVQPPNITEYGFTHDDETLEKLGNQLWEGAISAEEEFRNRAKQAHIDPDLLRQKLRDRYLAQHEKVRRLRPQQNGAGNPTLAAKTPTESSSAESGNN